MSSERSWLLVILAALVAGVGTWAFMEFVVWNRLPAALVGKWEVVSGPAEYADAGFEFFRNGNLVVRIKQGEKLGIIYAVVRVDGNNLFSTSTQPTTGKESTHAFVIRTLTEQDLVIEDEQGKLTTLRRAK